METTVHLGTVRAALTVAAREARRALVPVMHGRGIILLIDTRVELAGVLACARRLRARGCELPVACWHRDVSFSKSAELFRALGVTLVNAARTKETSEPLTLAELRLHALRHTSWREVLVLKPDVDSLQNPDALFERLSRSTIDAVFFSERLNPPAPASGNCAGWNLLR